MENDEVQPRPPDDGRPQPDGSSQLQTADSTNEVEATAAPLMAEDSLDTPLPDLSVVEEGEAEEQPSPALRYPVVGFGASAGGLQAFRQILEKLNSQTGMSFVLISHLAPDQKSFMSEIVERYTEMPVHSVENGHRPLPNHLYILLPNQSVTLRDGVFHVEPRSAHDRVPRTIDMFFRSLATDQRNHAIGVVLSGADADGALGLKAIKGE